MDKNRIVFSGTLERIRGIKYVNDNIRTDYTIIDNLSGENLIGTFNGTIPDAFYGQSVRYIRTSKRYLGLGERVKEMIRLTHFRGRDNNHEFISSEYTQRKDRNKPLISKSQTN